MTSHDARARQFPDDRPASREARVRIIGPVLGWGSLWGACLGFLLIAPLLLRSHHFPAMTPRQWLVVDGVLLFAFTALGAALSFYSRLVFLAAAARSRPPLRDPALAYGLAAGPLLVVAYFAATALVHWIVFKDLATLGSVRLTPVLAVAVASIIVLTMLYRLLCRLPASQAVAVVVTLLLSGALVGAALLPGRSGSTDRRALVVAEALPVVSVAHSTAQTPLLVVGVDGANWQTVRPLIAQRRLPTIARLIDSGMHGDVEGAWAPYWSSPAWAAILTGFAREETGIFEDLAGKAPGLPGFQVSLSLDPRIELLVFAERLLLGAGALEISHMRRDHLARPPFWEFLSRSGITTAVIRFFFSFPADGQADFVISNSVGADEFALLGVRSTATTGLVSPAAESRALMASFADDGVNDASRLSPFVVDPTWPTPRDAVVNPIAMLADAVDIDQRSFNAARSLLKRHPDTRVVALYLGGNDPVSHAFWQYRFPDSVAGAAPAVEDVRVLGPVIDRYWEFLDRQIGLVIEAFPSTPNVLLLSDHGQEASEVRPLWKGQHSARGVFVASGPDIPSRTESIGVSYVDVAPTIFQIVGLQKPREMTGRAVTEAQ